MPWLLRHFGAYAQIVVNAGVFVAFLVFLPYRRAIAWRSKGAVSAFMLALMAEMFGIPLLIYLLSPLFETRTYLDLPGLARVRLSNPHLFGWPGAIAGSWMILTGMLIIFWAWLRIHRATGLVTDGPYRYVRHPQYVGMTLILTGWILHWGTFLTLAMYPLLLWTYHRLARTEEAEVEARFPGLYQRYRETTPAFVAWPRRRR